MNSEVFNKLALERPARKGKTLHEWAENYKTSGEYKSTPLVRMAIDVITGEGMGTFPWTDIQEEAEAAVAAYVTLREKLRELWDAENSEPPRKGVSLYAKCF